MDYRIGWSNSAYRMGQARDYVLATKANRDEWHAIKELAEKRRRTISDLIRFLLVEETQKTAQ